MAECGGTLVIQATAQVLKAFEQDRDEGLAELVELAQADSAINDECDVFFLSLVVKGDSGCFEFENDYWLHTVKRLAATGKNIGLYLSFGDEYGAKFFLAQNPQGDNFSFFAGGSEDDFEDEEGDIVTPENLAQWLAIIPEPIKAAFPELIEVSY